MESRRQKPLPAYASKRTIERGSTFPVSGHFLLDSSPPRRRLASALLPLHLSAPPASWTLLRRWSRALHARRYQRSLCTPRPRVRPLVLRCLCPQALQARRYQPSRRPCTARPRPRPCRRRSPRRLPRPRRRQGRPRRRTQRRGSSGNSPAAAPSPQVRKPSLFSNSCLSWI